MKCSVSQSSDSFGRCAFSILDNLKTFCAVTVDSVIALREVISHVLICNSRVLWCAES